MAERPADHDSTRRRQRAHRSPRTASRGDVERAHRRTRALIATRSPATRSRRFHPTSISSPCGCRRPTRLERGRPSERASPARYCRRGVRGGRASRSRSRSPRCSPPAEPRSGSGKAAPRPPLRRHRRRRRRRPRTSASQRRPSRSLSRRRASPPRCRTRAPATMQASTSLARPDPAAVARAQRAAVSKTKTDELAKPASVNAPSEAPTATTTEAAPDPTAAAAVATPAPPSTEAAATAEPSAPAAPHRAEEPVTLDEAMHSAVMGKAVQPSSSLREIVRGSERNARSGELQ